MPSARIPFVDIMKGLCITMIVAVHVGGVFSPHVKVMLQPFRVPMYYFLSGLFFKQYGNFAEFLKRKVNNIIIPFFFFYFANLTVAFACSEVLGLYDRGLMGEQWNVSFIFDLFGAAPFHYGAPLWFLLSLFWTSMLYYGISYISNIVLRLLAVAVVASMSYLLCNAHLTVPTYIDTSLVALPYFFLGAMAKNMDALKYSKYDIWGIIALPLSLFIIYACTDFNSPELNIGSRCLPDLIQVYILPFIAIVSLFICCKNIKRPIPVLSYIGRYSIIVLGTHSLLCKPMKIATKFIIGDNESCQILTWVLLMIVELPIIWVAIRVFPRFTAQKPLIPLK